MGFIAELAKSGQSGPLIQRTPVDRGAGRETWQRIFENKERRDGSDLPKPRAPTPGGSFGLLSFSFRPSDFTAQRSSFTHGHFWSENLFWGEPLLKAFDNSVVAQTKQQSPLTGGFCGASKCDSLDDCRVPSVCSAGFSCFTKSLFSGGQDLFYRQSLVQTKVDKGIRKPGYSSPFSDGACFVLVGKRLLTASHFGFQRSQRSFESSLKDSSMKLANREAGLLGPFGHTESFALIGD